MTTAADLRRAIVRSAEYAIKSHPHNKQDPYNKADRLSCFVASLTGSLNFLEERGLQKIVWELLDHSDEPALPAAATPA